MGDQLGVAILRMRLVTGVLISACFVLAGVLAALATDDVDVSNHNAFAKQYNQYIVHRTNSVVDLRTIRRMRKAWRELERSAGWPQDF